jgi:hypothetical protein
MHLSTSKQELNEVGFPEAAVVLLPALAPVVSCEESWPIVELLFALKIYPFVDLLLADGSSRKWHLMHSV